MPDSRPSTEYCNQVNQMEGGRASVYAVWVGRSACRRAAGWDGEKERKGVRASNHQEAFPEPAESVSPWSVGSSNEEIDDHPITHVETMLHCPVGGKSTKQANLSRCSDRKHGLSLYKVKSPTLVSFSHGIHNSPFKVTALLFNDRKSQ